MGERGSPLRFSMFQSLWKESSKYNHIQFGGRRSESDIEIDFGPLFVRVKRSKVNCFWKLKGFAKAHPFSFVKRLFFTVLRLQKGVKITFQIMFYIFWHVLKYLFISDSTLNSLCVVLNEWYILTISCYFMHKMVRKIPEILKKSSFPQNSQTLARWCM